MKVVVFLGMFFGLTVQGFAKEECKGLKQVTMIAPAFWRPFACEAEAKDLGFEPEIAIECLKAVGVESEYKNLPYERAQKFLARGKIDAITGAFAEKVPFAILPKNILATENFCFLSRDSDKWAYESAANLKDRRFVYASGYIPITKMWMPLSKRILSLLKALQAKM